MIFLQHLFWLNQICSFVQYSVPCYWALLNRCNFILDPFIHAMTQKKAEILERSWKTSRPQFVFVFVYKCFFASTWCCPSEGAKACTQLQCLLAWVAEKALHMSGCLSDRVELCSDGGTVFVSEGRLLLCTSSPPGHAEGEPNCWESSSKQKQEVCKCLLQWKDAIICFL